MRRPAGGLEILQAQMRRSCRVVKTNLKLLQFFGIWTELMNACHLPNPLCVARFRSNCCPGGWRAAAASQCLVPALLLALSLQNMKALLTRNIKAVLVQTQSAKVKVRKKRRKGTVRYSEYDADGATPLDFQEWFSMMPLRVRRTFPASVIRTWFEEADRCEDEGPPPSMPPSFEPPGTSGEQRVSINSFFYFTISQVLRLSAPV